MLGEHLEEYINVDVGNAKKIDPSFLFEEELDYLMIGDIISKPILSVEIQNWLHDFWKISKQNNNVIKKISGFYISPIDISIQPLWVEFLQENIKNELIYPPIQQLKVNGADLSSIDGALKLVKDYSNNFIEFLLNDKKLLD